MSSPDTSGIPSANTDAVRAPRSAVAGDANSIERVARGDLGAFEELYDENAPTLYGIILSIVRDETAGQDVLQETFIQIWTKAESYSAERGSEIAWMIMIARSRALDALRRADTREAREDEAGQHAAEDSAGEVAPGPFRIASTRQAREQIRSALGEIPDEQSEALQLAFFSDLTHREVAAELEQPLGTIKTRIKLGMAKLRSLLSRFNES